MSRSTMPPCHAMPCRRADGTSEMFVYRKRSQNESRSSRKVVPCTQLHTQSPDTHRHPHTSAHQFKSKHEFKSIKWVWTNQMDFTIAFAILFISSSPSSSSSTSSTPASRLLPWQAAYEHGSVNTSFLLRCFFNLSHRRRCCCRRRCHKMKEEIFGF